MTLIIGILCTDGVVLGSDGAATLGTMASQTARQAVKKLNVIDDKLAIGVSGPVGMSQLFTDRLTTLWRKPAFPATAVKTNEAAMRILRDEFFKDIEPAFKSARAANGILHGQEFGNVNSSTVVALPINRKVALFQLDYQGNPEAATENIPFISIGCGQPIADPFLAFIRRVFWPTRLPSISDAIFAATWTLQHAIQISPGGVADPIQIVIVDNASAKELDDSELRDHKQNISDAEAYIQQYPTLQRGAVAQPPTP